jgi:hypothetical protein
LFVGIYSKKLFPVWNWPTIYQLKVTEFEQGMSAACSEMSEEQILHSASSIIRRDIESLDITEHEY